MYEVVKLESNLPADIASVLNTEEEAGWTLAFMTHDVPGTPFYCVFHKLPTAPKPPEGGVSPKMSGKPGRME